MSDITLVKKNEVYLKVQCDDISVDFELKDFFSFMVPGYQFTPQYRAKLWDGRIYLYNIMTKEIYIGLIPYIENFCKKNNYTLDIQCDIRKDNLSTLDSFLESLKFHSNKRPIEIREYQKTAIRHGLENTRALLLSPTGSGKSLIIYSMMRWHETKGRKQLIVVPTVSLVHQMFNDFADYATNSDWDVSKSCLRVYSGKEKMGTQSVILSTWQSIYKMPKKYFEQFDVVFVDETHLAKSKSITGILHKCDKAQFRIGTTGTLDGTKTHRLVLEGLFGPTFKVTSTKALMKEDKLADLQINCLQLDWDDASKKTMKAFTYQEEIDWLVTHPARNKFIRNLVLKQTGNTLVLFNYVEKHGKVLYEMISEKAVEGRKVFFVHGGVDAEDREEIRAITEKETNAIIVASYGVFSTGTNIRNLHNIVFASPSKSRIRNLQSIGRGLRKGDEKDGCKLFDIGDNLAWKSRKNYTLGHMIERIKIYAEEGFEYKFITVPFNVQ